MGFEKFCVKCGKTTDALINGFCSECYLKRHSLFEVKDFQLERCVKCAKARIKSSWFVLTDELIGNEISSKIKMNPDLEQGKVFVELTPIDEYNYKAKITVEGFLFGVLVKQDVEKVFSLKKVSCDACMKLVSNYREAILQLRAPSKEEVESMFETAKQFLADEQAKDSLSAAIQIFKLKSGGYDLWIGSNKGASKVARKVSRLFHAKITDSKKIIGEEGGRGHFKFRFTYLVKKE
jgi:NMD protein affecting ribosome stability and mRNA decay